MIDFNVIKVSLQEWIVRSSGLLDNKVVFEDQTAPRPEKPYISIKISTTVDIGQEDARGPIDDNGDAEFIGNREFTLGIKSYGNDPLNTLSLIRDSLNSPTELQTLRDNGVVFVDQLLFTDINELLETIWEERGQLDLLMRTTSISTHQVGIIERVFIGSEYQDKGATEILVEGDIVVTDPDAIAGDILEVSPAIIPMISSSPIIEVELDGYEDIILADGPIWYPRLGELSGTVAVDSIGVLNADGQYVNTPTLGVTGIPSITDNTAVSFDSAIPEYAHLFGGPDDFKFIHTIGVFTIEIWMKSAGLGVDEILIGNINLASATSKGFGVRFHSNDWIGLTITTQVNNVYVYNFLTPNNIISDTINWHHIVCTSNGVNGFIYVDGVQQGTAAMGGLTTGNATGNVSLASGTGAPFKPFKGVLDEPAIYNTYLNASKVLAHYNAGI